MAQQKKWTTGKIYHVPCPWEDCRKPNDFRDVDDYGLEVGANFNCDHCQRHMVIKKVEPTTLISVVPTTDRGNLRR